MWFSMMSDIDVNRQSQLPDMDFPVNAMAEGRILVPHQLRMPSNESEQLNIGGWRTYHGAVGFR